MGPLIKSPASLDPLALEPYIIRAQRGGETVSTGMCRRWLRAEFRALVKRPEIKTANDNLALAA
jgi:hypothetical protein